MSRITITVLALIGAAVLATNVLCRMLTWLISFVYDEAVTKMVKRLKPR
jgi:hypothetical protein